MALVYPPRILIDQVLYIVKTHVRVLLEPCFNFKPSYQATFDRLLCTPTALELLCGLSILCFLYHIICERTAQDPLPLNSRQALLSIFTPTASAWSSGQSALFHNLALIRPSRNLQISTSNLYQQVVEGTLEIRNPQDLARLFRSGLRIYGWTLRISPDLTWKASALVWILKRSMQFCDYYRDEDCFKSDSVTFPHEFSAELKFDALNLSSKSKSISKSLLRLDFVAYNDIERVFRSYYANLQPGAPGIVLFTSMSSSFSLYSDAFMLCTLPFMHRKYLDNNNDTGQRTPTPLFLTLASVTRILSSASSTVLISSFTNVTTETIATMQSWRSRIVDDKALRTSLVKKLGGKGWREHVFQLDWEIGLMEADMLTKWSVTVMKKP